MRPVRGMKGLAIASVAIAALGLAACGDKKEDTGTTGTAKTIKVGLAYDIGGRGDKSFNDSAAAGLEKAKTELTGANTTIETKELEAVKGEPESAKYDRLKLLCTAGYNPVIAVGFAYAGADPKAGPLAKAAAECKDTKFAVIDDGSVAAPNLANLVFAEEQGSYLVGAAAALKSKTKHVGFIGGCKVDLIAKFEAGFIAGAKAVTPDIKVDTNYLSTPAEACSGFNAPDAAETAANGMYDAGADVVYHAAGGSGDGLFKAAKAKNKLAIGVDSDQYNTVTDASLRPFILTSMLKRVDNAVYNFIKGYSEGSFTSGVKVNDLKSDGVGYSTSGGLVDDIKGQLDGYKAKIISGEIVVPTKPAS